MSATKEEYYLALKNDEDKIVARENSKSIRKYEKVSPLVHASSFGSVRCIEALVSLGSNPREEDWNKDTPLHYAKSVKAIKKLVELGADPNAKNEQGNTPLHRTDSPSVVKTLISLGADPNSLNFRERTPLMVACEYGQTARIKALLENGADPNITAERENSGISLLLYGSEVSDSRKEKGVSILLEYGANCNTPRVRELVEMGWGVPLLEKHLSIAAKHES